MIGWLNVRKSDREIALEFIPTASARLLGIELPVTEKPICTPQVGLIAA